MIQAEVKINSKLTLNRSKSLRFVRYDNERGKCDHRHAGGVEATYDFTSLENLLADFERDVTNWRE